jgi:hypothetical protein
MGAQYGASGMFYGVAALATTHHHTGDRAWRAMKMRPALVASLAQVRHQHLIALARIAVAYKLKTSKFILRLLCLSSQQNRTSGAYRQSK